VLSEGSRTVDARQLLKRKKMKKKSIGMTMMMIGGVTIMMIVASCCLIDTGVLDLQARKRKLLSIVCHVQTQLWVIQLINYHRKKQDSIWIFHAV
jgi:hypothetical protein